jgi:hypothetical protein
MATYLKCDDTRENKVARVKAVAECVMNYLSESVGEGDDMFRLRRHSVDRLAPVY